MAVQTITIDMEAYEALRRHKGSGKFFSDVIKEHFATRPERLWLASWLGSAWRSRPSTRSIG